MPRSIEDVLAHLDRAYDPEIFRPATPEQMREMQRVLAEAGMPNAVTVHSARVARHTVALVRTMLESSRGARS